ncbi:MAG TPA: ferritin family protein [Dehalococcoidia bacterium]|nr:ferritin family protein [Dehalococcoidia bacterium]
MEAEQDRTLEALQVAIQMELDGKEFYLEASRQSGNEMGRKLLASLAAEEDLHRHTFEEIYRSLKAKKGWPETHLESYGGVGLRTIFAQAMAEAGSGVRAQATELDAVKTAMDMENKTYDYYQAQGQTATYDGQREFYQALMAQEREHYLVLLDYYEYLKDPAGWFVRREHPSLDGG